MDYTVLLQVFVQFSGHRRNVTGYIIEKTVTMEKYWKLLIFLLQVEELAMGYGCYNTKPTKALEPCEKAARQWHVEFKSLHLFWSDALLKHLISDDAALVFINLWKQHADLFAVSILEKKQANMQNHVNHVHLGHESWS